MIIPEADTVYLSRCRTPPERLGELGAGDPRSNEHTEHVVRNFGLEMSWSTWGIDANVIVSGYAFVYSLSGTHLRVLAIHDILSTGRYP